jgi:hypothetical protein
MPDAHQKRAGGLLALGLVVGAVALTPQVVGGLLAGSLPLSRSARAADFDVRQFEATFAVPPTRRG